MYQDDGTDLPLFIVRRLFRRSKGHRYHIRRLEDTALELPLVAVRTMIGILGVVFRIVAFLSKSGIRAIRAINLSSIFSGFIFEPRVVHSLALTASRKSLKSFSP